MAETKLTNIIVPEVYDAYFNENFVKRSRFFRSGVINRSSSMDGYLAGGGSTFNVPFIAAVTATPDIPAETGTQTVNNSTSGQEIIRRQMRTIAFGSNAIANIFSGTRPLEKNLEQLQDVWVDDYDKVAIYTMQGIINDNLTNDSGDLVLDISDDASPNISDSRILQTQAKLKENGVSRADNLNGNFSAIVMHSNVYFYLVDQDAITFTAISGQLRPLAFYHGMEVIIDDNCIRQSESGGYAYTTMLLKPGAVQVGYSSAGYESLSYDRIESRGMGVDEVYSRSVFALHSPGFAWQGASMAGLSPTNNELAKAVNWNRVASNAQNCKFTALIHEVPDAWEVA
jgi:hypothetical protein